MDQGRLQKRFLVSNFEPNSISCRGQFRRTIRRSRIAPKQRRVVRVKAVLDIKRGETPQALVRDKAIIKIFVLENLFGPGR